jgi:hypothetical protein
LLKGGTLVHRDVRDTAVERFFMSIRLYSAATLALLALASTALAQDPSQDTGAGPAHAFGTAKQMAVSSDASLVVQHATHDVTTLSLAPAADYFVINNLSVGGSLILEYQSAGDSSATRFGIGPRVGYNFAWTDMLGVWPKLGFSYTHSNHSLSLDAGLNEMVTNSRSGNAFTLNLFVPIMFHPVPHFFVGFGPFLDTDLSGSDKITTYGLKLTIGGWFET